MKKFVTAVAMAAIVGINSITYAGFGLPSVPKVPAIGGSSASKSEEAAKPIDISGLTSKQSRVVKMMSAALVASATANVELNNALGKNTDGITEAVNLVKSSPDNINNLKKLDKEIKANEASSKEFEAISNGTEVQKSALKSAMEKASYYRWASYRCFGLAADASAGMVKEAGDALKSTKDFNQISKIKNVMDTGKLAASLFDESKKQFDLYDKNAAAAKQKLDVKEAKSDDAAVKDILAQMQDGFGF